MRSSSRRWWSITVIRRSMSSSRPATITRLPSVTRFPPEAGGRFERSRCLEVCPAHDSYFRSTIGRDRTTVPNARLRAAAQLMGALGD